MFDGLTTLLLEAIKTHGILAVVLGVVIETVIVPLPSPIIIMAAGAILVDGSSLMSIVLGILWISVVAGIAQTIGSFLVYGLAYKLGEPFINKFEKFHGVSWSDIENFSKKFEGKQSDVITLAILRALPIMPLSVVSGVCGVMKMPWKKYAFATLIGTIPRNIILAIAGFSLGEVYFQMADKIDGAETIMTIIIVGLLGAYVIGQKSGIFDLLRKKIM